MEPRHYKFIILGGGISGLSAALELQKREKEVLVLEKASTVGGVLQSINSHGFTWDRAAHTIAVDEELKQFFKEHGVLDLLSEPDDSSSVRQIAINGKIYSISNHPLKILTASYLSVGAKLKLLQELFKRPIESDNPTVYEFFHYHFGKEITEDLVSAIFAGIYAGDITKMEMKSVMKKIYELEQETGSLIKGLIKHKDRFGKRAIMGVPSGMEVLMKELGQKVNVVYNGEVLKITYHAGRYEIETIQGTYTCDCLISTLPSFQLAKILGEEFEVLAQLLHQVHYEPMVLIHLAFDEITAKVEKAFGFLCGQFSSPILKGAIYNSDLFRDRAAGKARSFSLFMKPEEKWFEDPSRMQTEIRKSIACFKDLTQIKEEPSHIETSYWRHAIPQFNKPFATLKGKIKTEENKFRGLHISGSYMTGVSVPDCIKGNLALALSLESLR